MQRRGGAGSRSATSSSPVIGVVGAGCERPRDDGPLGSGAGRYRPWVVVIAQPVAAVIVRLVLKVRLTGREHLPRQGAVLLVGNHQGLLDGPLVEVLAGRPVRALAKAPLFRRRVWGRLLRLVGQIPVHRGRPDRPALREAAEVLAGGGALVIFPEGTRGAGTAEQIEHGAAHVLLHCGDPRVPIVPFRCVGTQKAMPRGARLPHLRARVELHFGPPYFIDMPSNRHSRQSIAAVAEQVRRGLVHHMNGVPA